MVNYSKWDDISVSSDEEPPLSNAELFEKEWQIAGQRNAALERHASTIPKNTQSVKERDMEKKRELSGHKIKADESATGGVQAKDLGNTAKNAYGEDIPVILGKPKPRVGPGSSSSAAAPRGLSQLHRVPIQKVQKATKNTGTFEEFKAAELAAVETALKEDPNHGSAYLQMTEL